MCFIQKYSVIVLSLFFFPSSFAASRVYVLTADPEISADPTPGDIEMDYFYGKEFLRSSSYGDCSSTEIKKECRELCGPDNYRCVAGDCTCLDRPLIVQKANAQKSKHENLPPSKLEIKLFLQEFDNLIGSARKYFVAEVEASPEISEEEQSEERPALRHHIAHFCPDLEVARTCIRTCMKVGKPAFCGKDHSCYCGHKYNEFSTDDKVDINDVYAQFRDIYQKYFGADDPTPQYGY